jgi:ribonuclease R
LVPIDSLRDDRYTWRENTHEIVGDRWGRRFRAGDRVQVILDRVLAQERKLQFSIVEDELSANRKTAKVTGKQAKKNRKSAKHAGGSLPAAKAKRRFGKKDRRR